MAKSIEEINLLLTREDLENSTNAILISLVHMIQWYLMLKFYASCKKFWKLWVSKIILWRLIIEKFLKQWSDKLNVTLNFSKQSVAVLINLTKCHGIKLKNNLLKLKESKKKKLMCWESLLKIKVSPLSFSN